MEQMQDAEVGFFSTTNSLYVRGKVTTEIMFEIDIWGRNMFLAA